MTSKRIFGGTGLGLALSKHLAILLGGDVVLNESELNHGSTFVISVDPGPIHSMTIENATVHPRPLVNSSANLYGIKILLAEDSPDNQVLVSRYLKLAGGTVEMVSNGKEAVQKAMDNSYDVILMDLQMPVMDGYEATASLRSNSYKGKILALTAHASNEEREHCLRNGFDGHIKKPIDRKVLIERVQHFAMLGQQKT